MNVQNENNSQHENKVNDQGSQGFAGFNLRQTYTQLPSLFYETLTPKAVKAPAAVIVNADLAHHLGLDPEQLLSEEGLAILSGGAVPEGSQPIAQAYAGHQFGQFTILGDGRALLIGEQMSEDHIGYDLQLKGSGPTTYSRRGDGKAAIGPMLREYLISESLFALGIPTTRSLSVVLSGETIQRETRLPGAVMCRVARSHIRVGTFEYAAYTGNLEALKALAVYSIQRHDPELAALENPYLAFFKAIVDRQAKLIAQWQLVGFVHGVMNTDNMAISGESIDFGPCAFMDAYSLGAVFSSIDTQGRYTYGNQPGIGQWNLSRLAEALLPLIHEVQEEAIELVKVELGAYAKIYQRSYLEGMGEKLGLKLLHPGDEALIMDLLQCLEAHQGDYSLSFMDLSRGVLEGQGLYETDDFKAWHERWQTRIGLEYKTMEEAYAQMQKVNPSLIPRNHLVEAALKQATEEGNFDLFESLITALKNPYAYTKEHMDLNRPSKMEKPYRTYCGT